MSIPLLDQPERLRRAEGKLFFLLNNILKPLNFKISDQLLFLSIKISAWLSLLIYGIIFLWPDCPNTTPVFNFQVLLLLHHIFWNPNTGGVKIFQNVGAEAWHMREEQAIDLLLLSGFAKESISEPALQCSGSSGI